MQRRLRKEPDRIMGQTEPMEAETGKRLREGLFIADCYFFNKILKTSPVSTTG